jgi:iron complex transport system ATP-binding protein
VSDLQVADVVVELGGTEIIHGLSLDIVAGGWLGVVGPNGAGKSTLLRAIVSDVPFDGSISVDAAPLESLETKQRARLVSYVPQRPVYPQGMSVFDFVLLGRTPHMGPLAAEQAEDIRKVWEALGSLAIDGFADRDVGSLSGGETQRVSLARGLAQDAPVVVLDEATASLDVAAQHQVLELIDQVRVERGMTVISAIHDLTAAAQFCDKVVLLADGRAVASGEPREVLTEETLAAVFEPTIRVVDVDGAPVVVSLRSERSPHDG